MYTFLGFCGICFVFRWEYRGGSVYRFVFWRRVGVIREDICKRDRVWVLFCFMLLFYGFFFGISFLVICVVGLVFVWSSCSRVMVVYVIVLYSLVISLTTTLFSVECCYRGI